MPHIWADRVLDTTTTTGTGVITVAASPPSSYRTFSAVCSASDTFYGAIEHTSANEWEVGLYTYSGTNQITRTTVIASSNANAAVNFSSGTKRVFINSDASHIAGLDFRGVTLASAATVDIGNATSGAVTITGTTAITSFGSAPGKLRAVQFSGALTLTHNATSLILPNASNITTAAGDVAICISDASGNWRVITYQRASTVAPIVATVSATGTALDFGSIPDWASEITVSFANLSTNGASQVLLQLGDAGGVENSGYLFGGHLLATGANFTTGFAIPATNAANVIHGFFLLTKISGNTWACGLTFGLSSSANAGSGGGAKTLSEALDRVRLTTVNGTDAFDAGTVTVQVR